MLLRHDTTHAQANLALLASRDELFVTPYTRPAVTEGCIWLPQMYATDRTQTLWEALEWTGAAEAALGTELTPGDILVTLRRWPRYTGHETLDGRPVFVLSISAAEVRGVIKYAA